ncbi:probable UDP-N-acetylglucosamine--peptide N-acetylglucosaminyltransferase SEC isoform X2 [Aristolochia californica]|uniref:probable UDP-N-acetylglucosamine--peptide N-acetylglucosaminyltransferase SEC isoform X2 n=1 Tax=Aristolochia californica TaxID=171875 RepID=UPI0035DE0545
MAFRLPAITNGLINRWDIRTKGLSENDAIYTCGNNQARCVSSVSCSASKGSRGFGKPSRKEKTNSGKTSKEDLLPRKSTLKQSDKVFGDAPGLASGSNAKSRNFDRQFEEKLEAVRRSALEQKKTEESKPYQVIDYDAPVESKEGKISFGTKVGVGVAVVVFGLVFALGDFLPSGSEISQKSTTVERKLTEEETKILKTMLQQYEATLSVSPTDPTALEGAAVTFTELGDYSQAVTLLEKLTKERPKDPEAYRLLGEVKFELNDYEGSVAAYRSAASASEAINLELLRGLTNSLLAANKPDEAVKELLDVRESLEKQKLNNRDVQVDASDNLEKQTSVDPIQVDLLLGKAYSDWGHVSDAVAVYDKIISLYPNDFRGYLAKGIILKENGNVGDAERMFIQARFIAPDKAKAFVDRYSGR